MDVYTLKGATEDFWNIKGSFGRFFEAVTINEGEFSAQNGKISVISKTIKDGEVFVRSGKVKNISSEKVSINVLSSVFTMDGGEYEVYSQYNGWEKESRGAWQNLTTGVIASSKSVRNTVDAAPFMVIWSNQANRGVAFHLVAYSSWEMKISRVRKDGSAAGIEIEMGVLKDDLSIALMPGEELEMPQIIYYDVYRKLDMDAYKLHTYLNKNYPRKTTPVIYNTWFYKYDRFNFEDILTQIKKAKEIGAEYFVIDAGWFGKGEDWWLSRGDWEENKTFGFRGKMTEIADKVRENGMKFGFWIEAECASELSDIQKAHPDFFIHGNGSYFINFENKEALTHIFNKTCQLVDLYKAEFIKFDLNADLIYDETKSGFTNYFKGHREYIKMLTEKYPNLYVSNCASGGARMSVRDGMMYDSFWLSDNQSPYESLRIFKDTVLRMPPSWIERWAVIRSVEKFAPIYGQSTFSDKIIATGDGTWSDVSGVTQSFLEGFLKGSPIGLSFDLTKISDEVFASLKSFIEEFKKNRSFFENANCRILSDTDSVLVLQFSDENQNLAEIVAFTYKSMQKNIYVYPMLKEDAFYKVPDGSIKTGRELYCEGIKISITERPSAYFITLKEEK